MPNEADLENLTLFSILHFHKTSNTFPNTVELFNTQKEELLVGIKIENQFLADCESLTRELIDELHGHPIGIVRLRGCAGNVDQIISRLNTNSN